VAGHVRFELRNVGKNYPFERPRGFRGIKANCGHRDYSPTHFALDFSSQRSVCGGTDK
jgi:hypothetical protein